MLINCLQPGDLMIANENPKQSRAERTFVAFSLPIQLASRRAKRHGQLVRH